MHKTGRIVLLDAVSLCRHENKIYFSDWDCNEIYWYDMENKECSFLVKIGDEKEYGRYLFGKIIYNNDVLYLIPATATAIYCVDIKTRSISKHRIDESVLDFDDGGAKFVSAHFYKDKIYMVSTLAPVLVIFDVITKDIQYKSIPFMGEKKRISSTIYTRQTLLYENKIYIPFCKDNYICVYDLDKDSFEYHEIDRTSLSFSDIAIRSNGEIVLCPRFGNILVLWNPTTKETHEIQIDKDINQIESLYSGIAVLNEEIIMFPLKANSVEKIKLNQYDIQKKTCYGGLSEVHDYYIGDNEIVFFSVKKHSLFIGDDFDDLSKYPLVMPKDMMEYHEGNDYEYKISDFCRNENYMKATIIQESESIKLEHYIKFIKNL